MSGKISVHINLVSRYLGTVQVCPTMWKHIRVRNLTLADFAARNSSRMETKKIMSEGIWTSSYSSVICVARSFIDQTNSKLIKLRIAGSFSLKRPKSLITSSNLKRGMEKLRVRKAFKTFLRVSKDLRAIHWIKQIKYQLLR